jgi:predicted aspartyl protease
MDESFSFVRDSPDDLIIVPARIDQSIVDMVLDTGASHTFLDFGVLVKEGYRTNDAKGLVPVETANGIIPANRFDVKKVEALGIVKENFEVTSYLFDNPESTFKGVIGLDFLEDKEICINLKNNTI